MTFVSLGRKEEAIIFARQRCGEQNVGLQKSSEADQLVGDNRNGNPTRVALRGHWHRVALFGTVEAKRDTRQDTSQHRVAIVFKAQAVDARTDTTTDTREVGRTATRASRDRGDIMTMDDSVGRDRGIRGRAFL